MNEALPPLTGVKVIELGGIGPAPMACGILGDLGATVVRIERPGGSGLPGGLGTIGVSGRIVVELDAKQPDDLAVLWTMVAGADILVEGYRPGVVERLGIGPDAACARNPRLVYVRVTGWGQDGPRSQMAGHDINYIGVTGVLDAIGTDEPVPPLNLVGDYGGGAMFAVVGVLAALVERSRTGTGRVVDAAMVDGTAILAAPIRDLLDRGLWVERRASNLLDGGAPFYRTYRTADGRAVAVGAIEEPFYLAMLAGLEIDPAGLPDRLDPSAWPEIAERLADVFATRTRDEWAARFDGTDACVTPVLTFGEAVRDDHAAERRAYLPAERGVRPAPAPRMLPAADERMDQSASDTLRELGCTEEMLSALERAGAIRIA